MGHTVVDEHGLGETVVLFLFWGPWYHEVAGIDVRTVNIQQIFNRPDEIEALALLYELNDIACLAATKAFETVQGGIQHEGWGALVMEYAAAFFSMRTRRLQGDSGMHVKHEFTNVNTCFDHINVFVLDKAHNILFFKFVILLVLKIMFISCLVVPWLHGDGRSPRDIMLPS